MMLLDVFIGYLVADFLSGVIHFTQDNFFGPKTPLVGQFIQDGRNHHKNPTEMLKYNYSETNQLLLLSPVALAWYFLCGYSTFSLTVAFFLVNANQIHKMNHLPPNQRPAWFNFLRSWRIVQTQHHEHHRTPNQTHFCVLTDHLNPVLDGLGFWKGIIHFSRKFNRQ
jgi:ubiquitin-conjugating enzyme E2 variant